MRDAIHMYDQCIIALGVDPEMAGRNEEIDAMVDFLEEERSRLRSELKDLEDGTHELFGSVDPRLFNPGDTSHADIATMLLDMKE
tara:strand:- start:2834 stop:3088 length:255 start_codon:yes stop_codon:yes gene_type:complete